MAHYSTMQLTFLIRERKEAIGRLRPETQCFLSLLTTVVGPGELFFTIKNFLENEEGFFLSEKEKRSVLWSLL